MMLVVGFLNICLIVNKAMISLQRGKKKVTGRSHSFLPVENALCAKHQFSSLFLLGKLLLSGLKMALVGLKAGIIKSYQGIHSLGKPRLSRS